MKPGHASDCAVHNEPALPNGPCDCGLDAIYAELCIFMGRVDEAARQRLVNALSASFEPEGPAN